MSTITVNGIIDNPEPIYTHEEPTSPFSGQAIVPGTTALIAVKGFKNTGNVPQTVQVTVSDVTGVTVNDSYFAFSATGNTYGNQITLNPGFGIDYYLNVTAPDNGPGDDTEYSFNLATTWLPV